MFKNDYEKMGNLYIDIVLYAWYTKFRTNGCAYIRVNEWSILNITTVEINKKLKDGG